LDALGGKKRNRWGDVMVGETTEGHRVECRGRRMVRSDPQRGCIHPVRRTRGLGLGGEPLSELRGS